LIDYKKILKIADGVKQLTVPLLPDPNCSMPENDAQCVIPVHRTSEHSVRWADEMADRFEDVSDEDIELLLDRNGMVMLKLSSSVDLWLCACIYDLCI
jgi:predicted phosphoribosyltransferase